MPLPLETPDKTRARDYFEALAPIYEKHVCRGPAAYLRRREREILLRLAGLHPSSPAPRPGGRLLDAGCGSGFYTRAAKAHAYRVTAIDVSPRMIAEVVAEADEAWVADLETWETDQRFDAIICVGVLDFVTDPELCMRKLSGWLRPGGRLTVLVPRTGWGGKIYRIEKRFSGLRVNLFAPEWPELIARRLDLELLALKMPLPSNLACSWRAAGTA